MQDDAVDARIQDKKPSWMTAFCFLGVSIVASLGMLGWFFWRVPLFTAEPSVGSAHKDTSVVDVNVSEPIWRDNQFAIDVHSSAP